MLKSKNIHSKRSCLTGDDIDNQFIRLELMGQGTFGKVYKVMHRKTKKQYALKEVVQHPQFKNRQLDIISILYHHNIIEMIDYFFKKKKTDNCLYILMEPMDTSLAGIIKDQRKMKQTMSVGKRKVIAFQLLKALAYLEIKNVCHRDLKPSNVLINSKTLQLKVCDFGSSKIIEVKQNNVSYICSRYYRAPQLILNSTTYGFEIDMWSLGCIIVELMILQPVFPGDSSLEQLIEIIKILGTPDEDILTNIPDNDILQIPKVKGTSWSTILKRYNPSEQQIDLINKILTYDTDKRIRPLEALSHPYFADLMTYPQIEKLPLLFEFQSLRNKKNKKEIVDLQQLYDKQREQMQVNKQNCKE